MTTWILTFPVRRLAVRYSYIVVPDERRVHTRPTPTVGGIAMFGGLLVAIVAASRFPALDPVFRGNSEPIGVVLAAALTVAIFAYDDVRVMSPPAKVSGQVLAGALLYLFGVTMLFFHVPLAGTTLVVSPELEPVLTVCWVVGMANAVNLIDGLDGLAAGIVGIASAAFLVYSQLLVNNGNIGASNSGPLVAAIVLGLCVGFLPHNFHPAKIFMGDAGAMLLGLLMAASTISVAGQTASDFRGRTYFLFAPIVIPFFILGIPMFDTVFAIIRRAGRRGSPAVADKSHLHHRLMQMGHGQRRAVLILWAWTALLSGVVLYPTLTGRDNFVLPVGILALAIALFTLFGARMGSHRRAENRSRAAGVAGAANGSSSLEATAPKREAKPSQGEQAQRGGPPARTAGGAGKHRQGSRSVSDPAGEDLPMAP